MSTPTETRSSTPATNEHLLPSVLPATGTLKISYMAVLDTGTERLTVDMDLSCTKKADKELLKGTKRMWIAWRRRI
jgi:hypothetical protein